MASGKAPDHVSGNAGPNPAPTLRGVCVLYEKVHTATITDPATFYRSLHSRASEPGTITRLHLDMKERK